MRTAPVDFERARLLKILRGILERLDCDDLLRLIQDAAQMRDRAA
jgi:hypothetical protein